MATTSKPRKSTAPNLTVEEPTPVSDWKKPILPTPLPSGRSMRLRNVTFQTFMRMGMIPNSLLAVVQKSIDKGKSPELSELVESPKQVEDMVALVDSVVIFVALEPRVYPAPASEEERDENILYVDEVEDEDKMFIFGVCTGGTRDVETFRREQADGLASLQ